MVQAASKEKYSSINRITLCYLMLTFSRTSGSLVYVTCVTRNRSILKWHNNRQQTGWRLLAVPTVVSFLKLSKLNLKKSYKCLPLISGKKGILIVQKWKSAVHENLNKNSKCLSKVPYLSGSENLFLYFLLSHLILLHYNSHEYIFLHFLPSEGIKY